MALLFATKGVGADIDAGVDAIALVRMLDGEESMAAASQRGGKDQRLFTEGWIRLRGIAEAGKEIQDTREALQRLRERGLKTCVLLRWPEAEWKTKYLPEDLRAAYARGRFLGETYGNLVDAWEIDNEPDLGFVPENVERYTAFLKATYLGIKAGSGKSGAGGHKSPSAFTRSPLVLMAPLGLPPGPWLERFVANDGFAYTDGYNYHYYGYADDFSGAYRTHEAAARELSVPGAHLPTVAVKSLPVFLTEIGYGMLGKEARDTKAGRLRQWRWFKSVGLQADALRIEAPLAFYLPPYLEYDTSEYGLTVAAAPQKPEEEDKSWTAGGIEYHASDFQVSGLKSQLSLPEPWMDMIGTKLVGNEVTPALAQWLAQRTTGKGAEAGSRKWDVGAPPASPVVIDLLPGEGLSPVKRYNGHFVTATAPVAVAKPRENRTPEKAPTVSGQQPKTTDDAPLPPVRTEELIVHVRTANGNLYEVYPGRQAGPTWQQYFEARENFTLSPYGRSVSPWQFEDNRPISLMIAFYPKQLPAVFEFRRVQLIELQGTNGRKKENEGAGIAAAANQPQVSDISSRVPPPRRFGRGRLVLYNFSDKTVTGRLELPQTAGQVVPDEPDILNRLTLAAGERREIPVQIQVPADTYARHKAGMRFVADDAGVPPAKLMTEFLPALEGLRSVPVAQLLDQGARNEGVVENMALIRDRLRVDEEAPMVEQPESERVGENRFRAFAQQGARVDPTDDGFRVIVTGRPAGKPQRVEVEIPWPRNARFRAGDFLSAEFRLVGEARAPQ